MAFWNAPLEVSGHPALAVEAAIAMQEKLGGMNAELLDEFGVELRIGAGIHTGRAYVGNMGTEDIVNYTLIGDNVNIASRIEGLCPQYGLPIIVSGDTLSGCGVIFAWQYIDTINVKGKSRSVSVYTPIAPGEEKTRARELADWRDACDLYLAGNFAECREILRVLEIRFPESKLYSVYRERTEQLLKTPPSDWNGVWTFTSIE
jgi:adenylate cyclase